jgi:hypothetical protein
LAEEFFVGGVVAGEDFHSVDSDGIADKWCGWLKMVGFSARVKIQAYKINV